MKDKVKQAWIQALKSDEFTQHKGTSLVTKNDAYSVLGVLCKVYAKDQRKKAFDVDSKFYLPKRVQTWAGLKSPMGKFDVENPNSKLAGDLWKMNSEKSFKQLANIIDKNL